MTSLEGVVHPFLPALGTPLVAAVPDLPGPATLLLLVRVGGHKGAAQKIWEIAWRRLEDCDCETFNSDITGADKEER